MYTSKFFSFIAGVVDTAYKLSFAKISANFWKINRFGPNGILRRPGQTES
jgi:hypothetical protein